MTPLGRWRSPAYSRAMRAPAVVVPFMLIAACGPTGSRDGSTDARGSGSGGGDAAKCEEVIDVVFVLDTSSSMDFVLTKLESQIAQVVTASNMVAADSHFGLIVFQDNHFIDNTGPLQNGAEHTSATSLQTAFRYPCSAQRVRAAVFSIPVKPSFGFQRSSPKSTSGSSVVPPMPSGPTPNSWSKLAPPWFIRFSTSLYWSTWKLPR